MMHETLVEVLGTRHYKAGYEVHTEIHKINDADSPVTIKSAYTPSGDYIGSSVWAFRLCNKRGIAPEKSHPDNNVCSIGFCEREQKWYGWSHRAIYGFGVGSTVSKGDCAYIPATVDELFDSLTVPDDGGFAWCQAADVEKIDGGVRVRHAVVRHTTEDPETGELSGFVEAEPEYQVLHTGRGEWTAETLDDAKEMAIAFADSVS